MVKALCDKCKKIDDLNNLRKASIIVEPYGYERCFYFCASCVRELKIFLDGSSNAYIKNKL